MAFKYPLTLVLKLATHLGNFLFSELVIYYRAIDNKKIEMALINMLQLATRKDFIQMSSDVITLGLKKTEHAKKNGYNFFGFF
jgi:hypothetical protein